MKNELSEATLVAPQLNHSAAVQQGSQEQAHLSGHLHQLQDDCDLHKIEEGKSYLSNGSSSFSPHSHTIDIPVDSQPHVHLKPSLSSGDDPHRSEDEVAIDIDPHLLGTPFLQAENDVHPPGSVMVENPHSEEVQGLGNYITTSISGRFGRNILKVLSDVILQSTGGYLLAQMTTSNGAKPVLVVVFFIALGIRIAIKR